MSKLTALVERLRSPTEPYGYQSQLACEAADTILELCALLEKAEEALETCAPTPWMVDGRDPRSEALTAIKQWKEQK